MNIPLREESEAIRLPDPPDKPLDSDCCGNGCTPCVMDIYEEDLNIWKLECQALQTARKNQYVTLKEEPLVILKLDEYNKFSITDISEEAVDTLRIRFSLNPSQSLGLAVGQHVVIRSTLSGSTLTRQFTPVSPIDATGYFEIMIKIYIDGRMSNCVKNWIIGDQIALRGPHGTFDYSNNTYDLVVMLCAGTGIAPMCQVIHSILADEEDETRIRLLYTCHSYQGLLAKSELDEWQRFWNFSALFVLSQEPDVPNYSYKYGDTIHKGRMDKRLLCSELDHKVDKTLILICGTHSFDLDMLTNLEEMGVPRNQIHKF